VSAASLVPALTEPRAPRELQVAERTTASGLKLLAVRRAAVPLVELRLRIPFLSAAPGHPARADLLSEGLLTGTADRDRAALAAAVQALGAGLFTGLDADRLQISGNVLAPELPQLLALLGTVLAGAAYPDREIDTERSRLVERLTIARSRPGVVAAEALSSRMWGEHPYAVDLPQPDAVQQTGAAELRDMHEQFVRPEGCVLVLVGDVDPERVLDQAEESLGSWTGGGAHADVPSLPQPGPAPILIIDRPGSVQSSLRMARAAVPRSDERYPALQLANLVFGGYFSSRWTENLREDKGYTYGPHSRIDHHTLGSVLSFDVEVATDVTAPAVLETYYELGRIATLPVTEREVEDVRQYAIGTLALSTATQAGLASTLASLAGVGLGAEWIVDHPRRLSAVTVEDVSSAAAQFFGPAGLTSVVVGDAGSITEGLSALVPVETQA
jgi:predicted Zn-dependent peptidase